MENARGHNATGIGPMANRPVKDQLLELPCPPMHPVPVLRYLRA